MYISTRFKFKDYNFGFADSETEFNRNPETFKEAFYDPKNIVESLINENEFILIGNKGAGKTAYSAKIRSLINSTENLNAHQVSLSNFDFDVFSNLSRDNYDGSQKFKLAWDITLLIELYKFLNKYADYSSIDSFLNITEFLKVNNLMNLNSINSTVRRFTNMEINIKEYFKFSSERRKSTISDYSLSGLSDYFKESLCDIDFNGTKNLLIIDGLDDILRYEKSKIEILSGLFRSISQLNNDLYQNNIPIKIIILAREDILASITDPDFNKIKRDGGIKLNWNANELMEIVKLRFFISGVKEDKLDTQWYEMFPRTINKKDSFQYILQYTLSKPRDILQFLKQCKQEFPNESFLDFKNLRQVITQYSVSYFYEEMKNELSGFIDDDDIDNLELVFIDIGRIDFTYNRFLYVAKKYFKNKEDNYIRKTFNILYDNSYIGQIITTPSYSKKTKKKVINSRVVFKHKEPNMKINQANKFTLHKGIYKAFNMDFQR
ncbi:Uncharacterised protein [uncultured Clostridium sp.]|nr:Uncharacterised protein [uncultured Clostridium sp.]